MQIETYIYLHLPNPEDTIDGRDRRRSISKEYRWPHRGASRYFPWKL